MSAAAFLTPALTELAGRLAKELKRVDRASDDDEAVHDLRVALRRLRSILKPARRIYGPFHTDAVRAALKEIADATGDLRDEEVLHQTIADLPPDPATQGAREAWLKQRQGREDELRKRLLGLLRDGHGARAHAMLDALLRLPVDPAGDRSLERFAARVVERARHAIKRQGTVALDDTAALHEQRILYKRLRYAAESFAPALPPTLAALARVAERFQKRLGEVHDLDVALGIVADDPALDPPTRAALTAALHEARRRSVERYASERDEARNAPGGPASLPPTSKPRNSSPPPSSGPSKG